METIFPSSKYGGSKKETEKVIRTYLPSEERKT